MVDYTGLGINTVLKCLLIEDEATKGDKSD